jgi:hypothetical protein
LNWSNRSVFTGFHRFTDGKPLPVGSGFCRLNGFVNRAGDVHVNDSAIRSAAVTRTVPGTTGLWPVRPFLLPWTWTWTLPRAGARPARSLLGYYLLTSRRFVLLLGLPDPLIHVEE